MKNDFVLITGASSGIGLALAHEFASRGHSLIINAESFSDLHEIALDLACRYKVEVVCAPQDLTERNASQLLFEDLKAKGYRVEILINNAGVGRKGLFWKQPLATQIEIIRLNVEVVATLTRLFLPEMLSRGQGRIVNVASIAGYLPGPLMSVYHASKAFVLLFSEGLATELANTGVTITALCPGATDTEFFARAQAVGSFVFQKGKLMSPRQVAEGGYRAIMAGKRVYVAGLLNRVMVACIRFLSESFVARMTQFFYSDVRPDRVRRTSNGLVSYPIDSLNHSAKDF